MLCFNSLFLYNFIPANLEPYKYSLTDDPLNIN